MNTNLYINKINVGGTTYDIGMQNAIHFEGAVPVSSFYTESTCVTPATVGDLGKQELWTNVALLTLAGSSSKFYVQVGCMIVPAYQEDATWKNSYYEYVCTEFNSSSNVAKWSLMGEIKEGDTTITVISSLSSVTAVTDVDIKEPKGFVGAVTSLTPSTANFIKGDLTLATTTVKVLDSTTHQEVATAHKIATDTQKVITSVATSSISPITSVSFSNTGSVSTADANVISSVSLNTAGINKDNVLKSIPGSAVSSVSTATVLVPGSGQGFVISSSLATSLCATVGTGEAEHTLIIGTAYTTIGTQSPSTAKVTSAVGTAGVTSDDKMSVVTSLASSVISTTTAAVLTQADYTAPTLSTGSDTYTFVSTVGSANVNHVTGTTAVAAVTTVSTASATIASAFDTINTANAITDITPGTANALADVELTVATAEVSKVVSTSQKVVTSVKR